jgi:glucose-6-phosphate dehydrogenase assembly protein OpcA
VIVDLTDTTAAAIGAALVQARHSAGVPAVGMVMTLVIVSDEATSYDALRAALDAAREHPSRILLTILRRGRAVARLDAEVRFLGDSGPGETVVMRLHGELADHAESVLVPLLLPDAPVVVWWPGSDSPEEPAKDPVGALAQRRITDSAAADDPHSELQRRSRGYQPGDTDLAWTRVTQWRSLLAAALDQPVAPITGGLVACEPGSPSAELLASWLSLRLGVEITQETSAGPGITGVRLDCGDASIEVSRPDGRVAHLLRPGQPERQVSLQRRETAEIIAEELRRLDPDEMYGEVVGRLTGRVEAEPVRPGQPDEASGVSGAATSQ